MMKSLHGIGYLCGMLRNRVACMACKQRPFHTNSCLLEQAKFREKPLSLKKFKIQQAEMQKDDGLPVFLKRGFPDKVLYNLTLGLTIFNLFYSVKVMHDTDVKCRNS